MSDPRDSAEFETPVIREARIIALMIVGLAVVAVVLYALVIEIRTPPLHKDHAAVDAGFLLLGAFFIWQRPVVALFRLVAPWLPGRSGRSTDAPNSVESQNGPSADSVDSPADVPDRSSSSQPRCPPASQQRDAESGEGQ